MKAIISASRRTDLPRFYMSRSWISCDACEKPITDEFVIAKPMIICGTCIDRKVAAFVAKTGKKFIKDEDLNMMFTKPIKPTGKVQKTLF